MKYKLMLNIPVLLLSAGLFTGYATQNAVAEVTKAPKAAQTQMAPSVAKGKVLGLSNKAKTITLKDKKLGTVMIKFNDQTQGVEHARKGEATIVNFKTEGKDKIATVIKPKLAKLPKGVEKMEPGELSGLVAVGPEKGRYFLVDSRPGSRYVEGHIPSAVSIPVLKLKEKKAAILPADKDIQLIFYCGGPT